MAPHDQGQVVICAAADACQREARALRELDHPGIPAFVDAVAAHRSSWVVQAFVDGGSLAQEAGHHRYTEAEGLALLDELLGVLTCLHRLAPPVVRPDRARGRCPDGGRAARPVPRGPPDRPGSRRAHRADRAASRRAGRGPTPAVRGRGAARIA